MSYKYFILNTLCLLYFSISCVDANDNKVIVNDIVKSTEQKVFGSEKANSEKVKLPDLLVFISFSMPEQSLKQLSEQVKKAKGVLVLKGMYQGSLKKTVNMLHALNKQGVSAIIHPKLFTEYEITKAPTIILRDSKNQCDEGNFCTAVIDKISGNVPLPYALRHFMKEGHYSSLARKYLLIMGEKDV